MKVLNHSMNNEDPAYREIVISSLFSADWYLARNPDVALAGLNPMQHYLRYGAAEGRDPDRNSALAHTLNAIPMLPRPV